MCQQFGRAPGCLLLGTLRAQALLQSTDSDDDEAVSQLEACSECVCVCTACICVFETAAVCRCQMRRPGLGMGESNVRSVMALSLGSQGRQSRRLRVCPDGSSLVSLTVCILAKYFPSLLLFYQVWFLWSPSEAHGLSVGTVERKAVRHPVSPRTWAATLEAEGST